MILLWGLPGDGPLAAVAARLGEQGAPLLLVDQSRVARTSVEMRVGERITGRLTVDGSGCSLEEVSAAYIRPYDVRRVASVAAAGPHSSLWTYAMEVEDIMLSWSELTEGLVINRPEAMTSNDSKPFQLGLISRAGFAVPPTLVTTDPAAARAFWEMHRCVVYKSVGSTRSIVARLEAEHIDRLEDVRWCPTQFQRYVAGTDYRVHVVGDDLFAAAIQADRDDYRYAASQGGNVRVRDAVLPAGVGQRCVSLARSLGLTVAGIDLRLTPDGEWFCFEANPSPGFTFYQHHTGQPIDRAIASILVRPRY